MTRDKRLKATARRGFTLIELLVVMGIIAVLLSMLLPAINYAQTVARHGATMSIIADLETSLELFKRDWRVYPPSNASGYPSVHKLPAELTGSGTATWGFNCLMFSLCGPNGSGWGMGSGVLDTGGKPAGVLPLAAGTTNQSYDAYYKPETGKSITNTPDGYGTPARYIFYYRYDPGKSMGTGQAPPVGSYNVTDNPTSTEDPPAMGFADASHFLLLAAYQGPDGMYHWRRTDYLLISPGADRLYGYVTKTGAHAVSMSDGVSTDDDCNFNYK
jgi:prepilin-type N-terminal cleavage/methylation domain-containing protein